MNIERCHGWKCDRGGFLVNNAKSPDHLPELIPHRKNVDDNEWRDRMCIVHEVAQSEICLFIQVGFLVGW